MSTARFRLSPQTLLVFDLFLTEPADWRYGYDISRETGLKSGTLYPLLMRLAERSLLETRWEAAEPGSPPRHLYRLTSAGKAWAREQRELLAAARKTRRPAPSGARA